MLPVACWIPFFGKMWSRPGCFSWVAAPALFNIPIISGILKRANVMPAKAKNIRDALSKKSHSVGIVLDGVAGEGEIFRAVGNLHHKFHSIAP